MTKTEATVLRDVRGWIEEAGCTGVVRVARFERRSKHFRVVLEGPGGQNHFTLSHGGDSRKRLNQGRPMLLKLTTIRNLAQEKKP